MLSHALVFMRFAINILLPAPDAFQGAVLGCTLRFFGKTDKIIQLSQWCTRYDSVLFACGCLADRTENIQRC